MMMVPARFKYQNKKNCLAKDQKLLKMAVFGCKKMGLGMPKSKNGDHFLSPTIPKNGGIDSCFTRISFSGEFWANFENRVF